MTLKLIIGTIMILFILACAPSKNNCDSTNRLIFMNNNIKVYNRLEACTDIGTSIISTVNVVSNNSLIFTMSYYSRGTPSVIVSETSGQIAINARDATQLINVQELDNDYRYLISF